MFCDSEQLALLKFPCSSAHLRTWIWMSCWACTSQTLHREERKTWHCFEREKRKKSTPGQISRCFSLDILPAPMMPTLARVSGCWQSWSESFSDSQTVLVDNKHDCPSADPNLLLLYLGFANEMICTRQIFGLDQRKNNRRIGGAKSRAPCWQAFAGPASTSWNSSSNLVKKSPHEKAMANA